MAPGMYLDEDERIYILLPGPPKELIQCFNLKQSRSLAKKLTDGGDDCVACTAFLWHW